MPRLRHSHFAIAACVLFFAIGQVFVPLLGVEADEVLLAAAFERPRTATSIHVGHSTLPLMLMSFLGTLKAWLYRPLLKWPNVWTLREPMLVAAAATIWLFYLLLRRMAGERAALMGCLLLAADPLYLLTSCFDWGPVALQHLLLTGGGLLFLQFAQEGRERRLAAGAFLFGLALWDKALAMWMISGLGVAALVVYGREVVQRVTARRMAVVAAACLLGALPLVVFNLAFHAPTLHGNFERDLSDLPGKGRVLMNTLNGQTLFGYFTDEDWHTPKPHEPAGALQMAAMRLARLAGDPRHSLGFYAFVLAIALIPVLRSGDRLILFFALIAMAVAWIQMAIGARTGGSAHHTILLWPLPQMVVAISLAGAADRLGRFGRPAVAIVVAATVTAGLLVTNEYYVKMARNGGSQSWSDAIFGLNGYLRDRPSKLVYCMDWGMIHTLRYLSRGKPYLLEPDDVLSKGEWNAEDREVMLRMMGDSGNLFLARTKEFAYFPVNEKFLQAVAGSGYRRDLLTVISDSFGRPMFEVYRFVPASQ